MHLFFQKSQMGVFTLFLVFSLVVYPALGSLSHSSLFSFAQTVHCFWGKFISLSLSSFLFIFLFDRLSMLYVRRRIFTLSLFFTLIYHLALFFHSISLIPSLTFSEYDFVSTVCHTVHLQCLSIWTMTWSFSVLSTRKHKHAERVQRETDTKTPSHSSSTQ